MIEESGGSSIRRLGGLIFVLASFVLVLFQLVV
jgi:hypothetical protein